MREAPSRNRQVRTLWWIVLAIIVVGVVGVARTMRSGPVASAPGQAVSGDAIGSGVSPVSRTGCPDGYPVKGNINQQGQRISHVPGGTFYPQTNPETCFASEAEAWAAGFRPSRR